MGTILDRGVDQAHRAFACAFEECAAEQPRELDRFGEMLITGGVKTKFSFTWRERLAVLFGSKVVTMDYMPRTARLYVEKSNASRQIRL